MDNVISAKNTSLPLLTLLVISGVFFFLHGILPLISVLILILSFLCFFYASYLLTTDRFIRILFSLSFIIFLSFVPEYLQRYLSQSAIVVSLFLLFFKRAICFNAIREDFKGFCSMNITYLFSWSALFILIAFNSASVAEGIRVFDSYHIMYELSVGWSFNLSILNPPDISYLGETAKDQFLHTSLPLLFYNLLPVSIITSTYILYRFLLLFIISLVVTTFLQQYPSIKHRIFMILFFPSFVLWGNFQSVAQQVSTQILSGLMGFLLINLAIIFLINRKFIYLLITAFLLILSKGLYFLTLLGGVFLFFLRIKDYKNLLIIMSALIIQLISIIFWLGSAHGECLWMLGPQYIYDILYHFYYNHTIPYNILSYVVWLIFLAVVAVRIYMREKNFSPVLVFASMTLSGLIGVSLLTEASYEEPKSFVVAASFSIIFMLLWWIQGISKFRKFLSIVIPSIAVICFFLLFSRAYQIKEKGSLIDRSLLDAYTWMERNLDVQSVILTGKHYEIDQRKSFNQNLLVRSALSGRQLYYDGFAIKGNLMQPDNAKRFVNIYFFYINFVQPGIQSQEKLKLFFDYQWNKEPAKPLSEAHNMQLKLMYYLSFGKEWSFVNRYQQVYYEIYEHWNKLQETGEPERWATDFLKQTGITHIVLENGDKPTPFLQSISKEIYSNGSIMIMSVL